MKTKKLSRIPTTKISPYLPTTANHMFDKLLYAIQYKSFPTLLKKLHKLASIISNHLLPPRRLGEMLKLAYRAFSKRCFGKISFSKVVLFLAEFTKACKNDVERINTLIWFYEKSVPVIKKSVSFYEKARHAIFGPKRAVRCNKVPAIEVIAPHSDDEGQEVRTNLNKHCLPRYFCTLPETADSKFLILYEINQSAKGINADHPTKIFHQVS